MFWILLATTSLARDPGGTLVLWPCRPSDHDPDAAVVRVDAAGRSYDGAVVSPAGFIVTSAAVGWEPSAQVTLSDGRTADAEVLRRGYYLSLLRLSEPPKLTPCIGLGADTPTDAWLTILRLVDGGLIRTPIQRGGPAVPGQTPLPLLPPAGDLRPQAAPILTPDGQLFGLLQHPPAPPDAVPTWAAIGWGTLAWDLNLVFGEPVPPTQRFEEPAPREPASGRVLTKALLQRLPTGRSYQQQVQRTRGGEVHYDCDSLKEKLRVENHQYDTFYINQGFDISPWIFIGTAWDGLYAISPTLDDATASAIGASLREQNPWFEVRMMDGSAVRTTLTTALRLDPSAPAPWGPIDRQDLRMLAVSPLQELRLVSTDERVIWSSADHPNDNPALRAALAAYMQEYFICLDATLTSLGL